MRPLSTLLVWTFYLFLLSVLLLPLFLLVFALSPTFQSLLVHMHWVNFPFPFLTDFTQPMKSQWLSKALPCASYIHTANTSTSSPSLGGWLVSPASRCPPPPSSPTPHSDVRCASLPPFRHPLLYLHGNAENRAYYFSHQRLHFLTAFPLCADVFVFDYRGFAENSGFPTQEGLEEDARAMLSTLEGWEGGGVIRAEDVIVYGHSLGSAVALHLMDWRIRQGLPYPQSVILEGAFTSVLDNAMSYLPYPLSTWPWLEATMAKSLHHPWLSSSLLPLPSDVQLLFPPWEEGQYYRVLECGEAMEAGGRGPSVRCQGDG